MQQDVILSNDRLAFLRKKVIKAFKSPTPLIINEYKPNYVPLQEAMFEKVGNRISETTLRKLLYYSVKAPDKHNTYKRYILNDLYRFFSDKDYENYYKENQYSYTEGSFMEYLTIDLEKLCVNVTQEIILKLEMYNGSINSILRTIHANTPEAKKFDNASIKSFEAIEKPKDMELSCTLDVNTNHTLSYRVAFSRKLEADENITYKLTLQYENTYRLSKEELDFIYRNSNATYNEMSVLKKSLASKLEKATLGVCFPPIFKPKNNLMVFKDGTIYKKVCHNKVSFDAESKRAIITLEANELKEYSYAIVWHPPTIVQLLEAKIITEEQAEVLKKRCIA
jgi:hypothetical protein